jgi:SAM-dependent methyltransferase
MTSLERKNKLQALIDKYKQFKAAGKLDLTSEETIRTWLNAMLSIFSWDVRDTSQILQEKVLSNTEKKRLKEIKSSNTRPDYTFKVAKQKLTFLDAKDLKINLKTNADAAFQIKSYGWSILAPCVFISNFEQFVIYDSTYVPSKKQSASFGRIYLTIDEYINKFELLEEHLLKENIYQGKLNKIYSETSIKGVEKISPDFAFAKLLSSFRLELAKEIKENNSDAIGNNTYLLSYIVQVIINRILFIRVCEAHKLEEDGLLLSFKKNGFWEQFKKSSYFDFYEHYDGPLFERIDTIHGLSIPDAIFDNLLQHLYYPSPYRFDVIPTQLLSDIYEIFLSRKLKLKNGIIEDELKSEYAKTKGAVSTPRYIVSEVIRRTVQESDFKNMTIPELLDIKTLDLACGSGAFAIELYDYLEEFLKYLIDKDTSKDYKQFIIQTDNESLLSLVGKKAILDNCIYGIDIDPEAVEVTKMALALKIVDNDDYPQCAEAIGLFGSKILDGIGNNIRCGNTLVDSSIFEQFPNLSNDDEELIKTNVFDWYSDEGFAHVFESNGGFDFIVGNPPYVEVKNYNVELPNMHNFIKKNYQSSKNGKVDLAIPFIERGISLLNDKGRLGFIIQKRFFKTDYGKRIREFISDRSLVSSIIDFQSTSIFKERITYVAILTLENSINDRFYYQLFDESTDVLPIVLRESAIPENDESTYFKLPAESLTKAPWSFDDPEFTLLRTKLLELGTFGDAVNVRVGIQALWDKAYHIRPISIEDGILTGKSHIESSFQIELDACHPLICNEHFYPYRSDNADVYVIFPYDVNGGEVKKIKFSDFQERFPLAATYLNRNKATIQDAVETLPLKYPKKYDDEYWHLFTREQNHRATYPKVLVPMTALDTFATITFDESIYCDNANVNFVELEDKTESNLFFISGIINSTVFSVLARSIANPQTNGYYKFNKQFLEPIPFPVEAFNKNQDLKNEIVNLVQNIIQREHTYFSGSPNQKRNLKNTLERLWSDLDEQVYNLYELTEEERQVFRQKERNINRVDFLNA